MNDKQLSDLFAEGTAPEPDPVFARRVAAAIGRTRLQRHLLAFGLRAAVMLTRSAGIFVVIRLSETLLAHLVDRVPQFMGVPVPLVVGVCGAALFLRIHLHVPFPLGRHAPPRS